MSRPQQLNITQKVILGFCTLISIFFLFDAYTLYDIHKISQLSRIIYNHPLVVSNAALQANSLILKIHRNMKNVVLFHSLSRIQQSIEMANDEEEQVHRQLDIVKNNILGDEGKALEIEARKIFDAWRPIRNEVIGLVYNDQREKAANITIEKGANHVALIETKMLGLLDYAKSKASEFNIETDRIISRINVISIVLLLLGTSVSFLVAFTVVKWTSLTEEKLRESEEQYRRLFETANDGIILIEKSEGKITRANPSVNGIFGYSNAECIGSSLKDIGFPERVGTCTEMMQTLDRDGIMHCNDVPIKKKNGQVVDTDIYFVDKASLVQCNVRDITERKRLEMSLLESEERYCLLTQNSLTGIYIHVGGLLKFVNNRFAEMLGYAPEEIVGRQYWDFVHPEDKEMVKSISLARARGEAAPPEYEFRHQSKDGKTLWVHNLPTIINYQGQTATMGNLAFIDDRKRAEKEKVKFEAQFHQAQKMESVGRLAGGVAHDYNNISSIIIGFSELALEKVKQDDPVHDDLMEIYTAANRSTDITRQLLAFARQQTIAPKVLDLNDTIESMLKMLRRLIGEDINLAWIPHPDLWPVKMDPSQLDQILANLCVNARDAITDVGKLSVETQNVTLDEAYCADHAGFVPGEFTLLAVSDSGSGMDKETLEKLFEPFFTTKGVGQGTGLGLSTVYGIVKQNDGFINVYSEPGKGSTFKIYLPRHTGKTQKLRTVDTAKIPTGRGETVLVVEDEVSILKLAHRILDGLGYKVLVARTPGEAMDLVKEHTGNISLLITDVVMPEMNGRDLAERLHTGYPDIKTLFMSGYTANVIAHRGVLEKGVNFIQKPFSRKDLAVKVRETLDKITI